MSEREEPILEWIEGEQAAGRLAQPHVVERSQEVPATQPNDTQDDFEVVREGLSWRTKDPDAHDIIEERADAALQRIREERDALRAKAVQQGKYAVELAKQVAELTEHTAGLTEELAACGDMSRERFAEHAKTIEERDALRAERDEARRIADRLSEGLGLAAEAPCALILAGGVTTCRSTEPSSIVRRSRWCGACVARESRNALSQDTSLSTGQTESPQPRQCEDCGHLATRADPCVCDPFHTETPEEPA